MMEKRNFVTSIRTGAGATDIDDILDNGAKGFGRIKKNSDSFEKKASIEDEKSDRSDKDVK